MPSGRYLLPRCALSESDEFEQVSAVQQIKYLADRDHVDRDCPGELVRSAPRLHPEECRERDREERQPDEDHAPNPEAGQDRPVDRARRAAHHVELVRLERDDEAQRNGGHHVDPQHLRRGDRDGEAEEDRHHDDQRLGDVGRQHEEDGLLDVVVDGAPFLHRRRDRGEVVVGQNHAGRFLGDLGALDPHGDADVGLLQSGSIVYAVARHRHDLLVGLDCLHQAELVLGARAREHVDIAYLLLQRRLVHVLDLGAGDRRLSVADAEHLGDRRGGDPVIAGDHGHADTAAMTFLHRLDRLLARRVEQTDQAEQDEVFRQVSRSEAARPSRRDFRATRAPARARPGRRACRRRS